MTVSKVNNSFNICLVMTDSNGMVRIDMDITDYSIFKNWMPIVLLKNNKVNIYNF